MKSSSTSPWLAGAIVVISFLPNQHLSLLQRLVFHTDTTDSYYDHRRRHVIFFVDSKYL
jgi:hypothetical protein